MQRRRGLALILLASTLLPIGRTSFGAPDEAKLTVFVVRHAEAETKTADSEDPLLNEHGAARAAELVGVLANAPIAAVYATPYRRTRMTAAPVAGARGLSTLLYDPRATADAGGLPDRATLLEQHAGTAVLVVGHSNTVPRILAALGGPADVEIEHDEHDNLFVLELEGERTTVRRHRYGPLRVATRVPVALGEGASVDGEHHDISGVTQVGARFVVCSDEGTSVHVWERRDDGFVVVQELALPVEDENVTELDLEGLASGPGYVYAVGSHSLRRTATRENERSGDPETWSDNRDRLATVKHEGKDRRDRLYRIPVDGSGALSVADAVSLDLRPIFEEDPWIGPATRVPGKENGLDVEALAVDGDALLLGLRGPVLRGGYVPIVRVRPSRKFVRVKEHSTAFVQLDGRGVRGLARCGSGFLLLAGPVGDASETCRVYHWDGEDMLPGRRKEGDASSRLGRVTLLGSVPATPGGGAEGLTVLQESPTTYRVLLVFDGALHGAPTEVLLRKVPGL